VTDSNVTVSYRFRMARDRGDLRWQHLEHAWQRLLWARETHGSYRSAAAFARVTDLGEHGYKAYERDPETSSKSATLDFEHAVPWADLLDVRWEWLLRREGVPWRDEEPKRFSAEVEEVASMLEEQDPVRKTELIAAFKTFLGRTGTSG
jgi:hypothetical protein